MSRRHFIRTAAIVSMISNNETRTTVANDFANFFAEENANFDRTKFLTACKV